MSALIYEAVASTWFGRPVWVVKTVEGVVDSTHDTEAQAKRRAAGLNAAEAVHEARGYTEEARRG